MSEDRADFLQEATSGFHPLDMHKHMGYGYLLWPARDAQTARSPRGSPRGAEKKTLVKRGRRGGL